MKLEEVDLWLYCLYMISFVARGSSYTVKLQPSAIDVIENGSENLTCFSPDISGRTFFSSWTYSGRNATPIIYILNNTCDAKGYFKANPALYAWSCPEDNTFVLTLLNVNVSAHQNSWICNINFMKSNKVEILVKVPVKSVEMKSHTGGIVNVKETLPTRFVCHTTCSRPEQKVFWFLNSSDERIINVTSESRQSSSACGRAGFTEVKSELNYTFNRTFQGWSIYCLAANIPGRNVTSSEKRLNVLFPPDGPPVFTGIQNGSKYRVVEHENAKLSCAVSGGNPLAHIVWMCFNGNVSELNETDSVTSNVTWTTLRNHHHKSCTCIAEHTFGNKTTSVIVEVMYPPNTPHFIISSKNVSGIIRRIQNNSLIVTCRSYSYPESDYTWIPKSNNGIQGPVLRFARVQNHNNGRYICKVNNTMIGSNGVRRFGSNNSTITVQVMYPPIQPTFNYSDNKINTRITGQSFDVIKGDIFTIHCLSEANPNPGYRWEGGGQGSASVVTAVETITKTCIATNTMQETVGENKSGSASAMLSVSVQYPPAIPTIDVDSSSGNKFNVSKELKIIERVSFTLTCKSEGKPIPKYRWYVGDSAISQHIFEKKNVSRNESGRYTCNAFNNMTRTFGNSYTGSNNKSLVVDVLYPPLRPTFNYSDNTTNKHIAGKLLTVIKGDIFTVYCLSDANPNPGYRWEDGKHDTTSSITASKTINKTCTVTNTMRETVGRTANGSASATLAVIVLYPPVTPKIHVYDSFGNDFNVSTELDILEGESFNLTCTSESRPKPEYKWFVDDSKILLQHLLQKKNIGRNESGNYTCNAFNTMIRTVGNRSAGSSTRSLIVDILYPAHVDFLSNRTIVEGDFINITCPVISGNPAPTSVKWSSDGALADSTTHILYIANVSRYDEGTYTCTVNTTLTPTYSNKIEKLSYGHFYMSVVYRAQVKEFYIGYKEERNTLTVNESEHVTFLCKVDSKPSATAHISVKGKTLYESRNSTLEFIRERIQCSDFGTYSCSSMNDYNYGVPSIRNIRLYVNCSPRPSKDVELKVNVTSAIHASATLSFTAVAYPEPGPSGYVWNQIKGSERVLLENSTNVKISRSSLEINLTISNVTEDDYGQYVLQIINKIGVFEQRFNLNPGEQTPVPTEAERANTSGVVAGLVSSVVIVIIVLIVLSVYIFRKRNVKETEQLLYQNVPCSSKVQRKKKIPDKLHVEETRLDTLQEVDVPIEYYSSPSEREAIDRIKVSELFSYVLGKDVDSFAVDYQKLPAELTQPCTFARKPENLPLNRYKGIYPYDHSRVKFRENPDFFINACYIDGYKRSNTYIASLGPTASTTNHFETFWQMIWHEKSDIIVMLTNLREPSGMKCERYWPKSSAAEMYGDVCVSCHKAEVFAEYTVRTFTVSKDEERRTLTHLHYTAWPDKKVPEDVTSLLEFRQRMRTTPTSSEGPIVVHCSAGIGRTGTLIAIDRLIAEGQCEDSVNVFKCVNRMREQRVKMVQTLEQYVYIYKSLVNALTLDCGTVAVENIQEYMNTTNNNIYSRQYQQLKQTVETDTKEDREARSGNERRIYENRKGADIPAGRYRVMLYLNRDGSSSDYINAVYMNSFKKKDYFIVAQSPLKNTVEDFVCMIYQENCTCIVTLEDMKEPGMDVGVYLPTEKHTLTFGNFKVSCTRLATKHHCVIRKVTIEYTGKYDSGKKTFYHFQYNEWTVGHDTPVNSKAFVQFVTEVEEYATQFNEEMSHTLVHCLKANERSGLFCAVQILTEKLKHERQVNVSNTIRHMRTRRQTAITSMEQLKFCYQAACDYVQMFQL